MCQGHEAELDLNFGVRLQFEAFGFSLVLIGLMVDTRPF